MSKLTLPFLLLIAVGMLVYLKLGFMFMIIAALPSFVAYFIDRLPGKPTFYTVFACNAAAAIHPIADLYSHGVAMSHERFADAMGNGNIWLFVYCGAAAGWGLVYACHFIAHFAVETYHEYQLFHLKQQQDWLLGEWGDDIKPATDED